MDTAAALDYVLDESTFDPASLAAALTTAYRTRPRLGTTIDERWLQRRAIAEGHSALYRSLVG